MSSIEFKTLLAWSQAKEIQTKNGPRLLSKARPDSAFWDLWRSEKDALKAGGISVGKSMDDGDWEVCWWQPISEAVQNERREAIEQSRAVAAEIDLPHPDGLDYMPFQKAGIRYALERDNVLFADEMGLGKTIEAIGVINADETIKTVLVVCPKSLKLNWQREMERWLVRPMSIGVANGSYPVDNDVVILNYEGVKKYAEQITQRNWDMVIVDECHYIKNPKAQRSQAVKAISARRKLRLTGTPIVNRPAELYNIIEDMGGDWGSFFSFARRYCDARNNGWGWDFSGAANLDELQTRLRQSIMVRRLKADVLTELPRKIRQIIELEAVTAAQRAAVKAEKSLELSKAESEEAYRSAVERLSDATRVDFAEMARLRHETAIAKAPLVVEHVQGVIEDNNGYKVIIGAHHHDMIGALMEGLAEFDPVRLTGKESEQERQAAVDRFQADPACKVFIGSIQAAGVGITLTASHHVVFAELDWVPGNVSQFEDRAHRIGQLDTVLVQHLVLSESLDARMAKAIVEKQRVIDQALDMKHPERMAPVYEPTVSAATRSETVDRLAEIAAELTQDQIELIHEALRFLAGLDTDHANVLNGIGFNKLDTKIGHSLANCDILTSRQAALGVKICRKYHRQLPSALAELAD